jgi:hypothetical protein
MLWNDRNWRIVLQNSFWITEDKFSGLWGRGDRTIVRGTTAIDDELTGNLGSALEDTSTGDCRLLALFAEKSLQAIFGLQHYRRKAAVHRQTE